MAYLANAPAVLGNNEKYLLKTARIELELRLAIQFSFQIRVRDLAIWVRDLAGVHVVLQDNYIAYVENSKVELLKITF